MSNLPHAPRIWMLLEDWFHSPLHFVSLSPLFPNRFASSPNCWTKLTFPKKDKSLPTADSPVPPATVLLSSQVSCCTPAFLPSFVRRLPQRDNTENISSPCVITHSELLCSVLRAWLTEECRLKSRVECFWLKPRPGLAPLPPPYQITLGSFNSLRGTVEPLKRPLLVTMQTTNSPPFSFSSPLSI